VASAFDRRHALARSGSAITAFLALMALPRDARSADAPLDSPASAIDAFYKVLLDTMKQAKALGVGGRYDKLKAIVEATFDFPAMTETAVGSAWSGIPDATRAALIDAFKRMTTATYAHNFDGYDGERFEVDPKARPRGGFQVVHSALIRPNQESVVFDYLMHPVASTWKAVDIYYSGTVSQLAQRRSEFSAVLRSGGADGLLQRLRNLGDQLLKESQ
jgi:phospholipid transport system substrate-binding protein